jgi:hypothetical protein
MGQFGHIKRLTLKLFNITENFYQKVMSFIIKSLYDLLLNKNGFFHSEKMSSMNSVEDDSDEEEDLPEPPPLPTEPPPFDDDKKSGKNKNKS